MVVCPQIARDLAEPPQSRSSSHKEGLEGTEEATVMGLDNMAS